MELYHVLNRGVEKRSIFMDDQDRARFIHGLYIFNDVTPAPADNHRRFKGSSPMLDLRSPTLARPRKMVVDIHGWCLMGNHYHLLLSERAEGGLTKFLRKLNIGYAKYFNERYTRSGGLFQGRTKKVLIKNDAHFLHILNYIHFNPLDTLTGAKEWRAGRVANSAKSLKHLSEYKWSSYQDYCGRKNFPSILTKELFKDVFTDYAREAREYIKDLDTSIISPLTLE
ncbi:MAG: transposase [Patescibacteria group bacterium]